MNTRRPRYLRHRFPPEIISHAVWLYRRYCLSFRDVEDLLAERGIIVSYETIRPWCGKFGPDDARGCSAVKVDSEIRGFWTQSSSRSTVSASICGAPWTKTVT